MDGNPPLIRLVSYEPNGSLQLLGSRDVSIFGCVPVPGDVLSGFLIADRSPMRIRRRVFIPEDGERDVWWLFLEEAPNDAEAVDLCAFDREIREEFRLIDKERGDEAYAKLVESITKKKRRKK